MDFYGFRVYEPINSTITRLFQALAYTWSTKRFWPVALRTQTWRITRDRQGCHHLPPTLQPWGTRQVKVASSLDTTSTLSTTTLALYGTGLSVSIRSPLLEYPLWERTTNPQANKSKA
jgi:hypothetical protein